MLIILYEYYIYIISTYPLSHPNPFMFSSTTFQIHDLFFF